MCTLLCSSKLKTLLIIGGTGFFGKSFVSYYKKNSFKKWGINNLIITSRHDTNIGIDARFYKYDAELTRSLPDADYIIYAASSSDSNIYINRGSQELETQKKAINNLNNILQRSNFDKILYTSSGAVYGRNNLSRFYTNEIDVQPNPNDNDFPKNLYAKIKVDWENFFIQHYQEKSIVARCFAFLGDHLPINKHFAIGNFINDVINNRDIVVNADISVFRSYLSSIDLVEWILKMITSDHDNDKFGNVFNIGSTESIEIHSLANMINKICNRPLQSYSFDKQKKDIYIPDVCLAKNIFSLSETISLEKSIIDTLRFHGFSL